MVFKSLLFKGRVICGPGSPNWPFVPNFPINFVLGYFYSHCKGCLGFLNNFIVLVHFKFLITVRYDFLQAKEEMMINCVKVRALFYQLFSNTKNLFLLKQILTQNNSPDFLNLVKIFSDFIHQFGLTQQAAPNKYTAHVLYSNI